MFKVKATVVDFIGDIEINDPYFICLKPVSGKVNFVIEGLGNKALIKEN